VARFCFRGYRLNVHVNGMSNKGYWLALAAALAGRLCGEPARLTFHGGLGQDYFPRPGSTAMGRAFRWLFQAAGGIACDSEDIRRAIVAYGISADKVIAIGTFSPQYLDFAPTDMPGEAAQFLHEHQPVVLSYMSFRPEYALEAARECLRAYCGRYPDAG